MAQRISRAKQAITASGARFEPPGPAQRPAWLRIVLHVLYLIFNEGYTATAGAALTAPELSSEAIRLTRWLHRLLPQDPEITGLLALMLLTEARRGGRTGPDGSIVALDQQDRGIWDHALIAEGPELISSVLRLATHHRLHATKAHLLEMSGDFSGAAASYREAARRTTSVPERRYLISWAARLAGT